MSHLSSTELKNLLRHILKCLFKYKSIGFVYEVRLGCYCVIQVVYQGLLAKNHSSQATSGIAVINSIRNRCGSAGGLCIEAISDARKGGVPDGS